MISSRPRWAHGHLLALCLLVCAIALSLTGAARAAVARDARHHSVRTTAASKHRARGAARRRRVHHTHVIRAGAAAPAAQASDSSQVGQLTPQGPASPSQEVAPPPAEPAQEARTEEQTPQTVSFQPGINSGSAAIWELPGAVQLGAKLVRVAVPIEETAANFEPVVAAYAEKGIRVALLVCFDGTLPTPAQAKNLATWASAFGPGGSFWSRHAASQYAIQTIEFGNETSLGYQYADDSPAGYASRAQTYALRFAEAAIAIRAVNPQVGLLAQGDSGNAGPIWVESMFKAVPNLGSLVAGWTVHPYGPNWRAKLGELVSQTTAQGAPASIPIDVTEWGLTSDNGRCLSENYGWNRCMNYQEAAAVMSRTVSEMRQALDGRLGQLLLYQIRDQKPSGQSSNREDYFGAVQRELQPKGAYTSAVESLLAS